MPFMGETENYVAVTPMHRLKKPDWIYVLDEIAQTLMAFVVYVSFARSS